jgi:hypothetical protein
MIRSQVIERTCEHDYLNLGKMVWASCQFIIGDIRYGMVAPKYPEEYMPRRKKRETELPFPCVDRSGTPRSDR